MIEKVCWGFHLTVHIYETKYALLHASDIWTCTLHQRIWRIEIAPLFHHIFIIFKGAVPNINIIFGVENVNDGAVGAAAAALSRDWL